MVCTFNHTSLYYAGSTLSRTSSPNLGNSAECMHAYIFHYDKEKHPYELRNVHAFTSASGLCLLYTETVCPTLAELIFLVFPCSK